MKVERFGPATGTALESGVSIPGVEYESVGTVLSEGNVATATVKDVIPLAAKKSIAASVTEEGVIAFSALQLVVLRIAM